MAAVRTLTLELGRQRQAKRVSEPEDQLPLLASGRTVVEQRRQ